MLLLSINLNEEMIQMGRIGNLEVPHITNLYDAYGNIIPHMGEYKEIDNYGHDYTEYYYDNYSPEDKAICEKETNDYFSPVLVRIRSKYEKLSKWELDRFGKYLGENFDRDVEEVRKEIEAEELERDRRLNALLREIKWSWEE